MMPVDATKVIWTRHCLWTFVNREIELWAKEANYKEHSLECSTVCSRELDIN